MINHDYEQTLYAVGEKQKAEINLTGARLRLKKLLTVMTPSEFHCRLKIAQYCLEPGTVTTVWCHILVISNNGCHMEIINRPKVCNYSIEL